MANLQNRLRKGFRAASGGNESDEDHAPAEPEKTNDHDALHRLGVSAETVIPDTVLSSRETKTMRFARSSPGYYYSEVESALDDLTKTINWHESTHHRRDLDIHKLATEIDQLEATLTNKNYQLESLSVTGSNILVDENQQPMDPGSYEARLAVALESEQSLQAALENSNKLVSDAKNYTDYQARTIQELEDRIAEDAESLPTSTSGQAALPVAAPNEELDELRTELEEKTQALVLLQEENNRLAEDTQGQDVSDSPVDDEDLTALRAELEEKAQSLTILQNENDNMSLRLAEAMQVQGTPAVNDSALAAEYAALQEWAEVVTPQYEEAMQRIESLEEDNADLKAKISDLDGKLDQAKEYAEGLEKFAAETDAYIDQLQEAADAAVASSSEITETAHQYLDAEPEPRTVEAAQPTHGTIDDYDDGDAPAEIVPSTPTQRQKEQLPSHSTSTPLESSGDNFSAFLNDLSSPEVTQAQFSKLKQSRPTMGYVKSEPGAPLTSLRPGESAEDLL